MMHFNNLRRALCGALTGAMLLLGSCKVVTDDTVGDSLVPNNQQLRGGFLTLPMPGEQTPRRYIETRHYLTDSIGSSNLSYGYFGKESNDTIGHRSAGFMTQMTSYYAIPEGYFGYRPFCDSVVLNLTIPSYGLDTLTPQRFEVYEIVDNSYIEGRADSTFYANFDPTPYISREPLFTFTFPDGKHTGPSSDCIRLEPTAAGDSFVHRLLLQEGTYSQKDGKKQPDYSIYSADSLSFFAKEFKGICIRPVEEQLSGRGSIFGASLETSSLSVYGRSLREEDPSLVKDTIDHLVLAFYDQYVTEYGGVSINTVHHDYTDSRLVNDVDARRNGATTLTDANRPLTSQVYVEAMAGAVTELTFTQEIFDAFDRTIEEESRKAGVTYSGLGFGQALMFVYFTDSDYDAAKVQTGNVSHLICEMDAAPSRLGLYLDYKKLVSIADYAYAYEKDYSATLAYGGYVNRSRGCYTFDITAHMQHLWNEYRKECEAAKSEGRAVTMNNIPDATIYLGPEAYSVYGNDYGVLQGMSDSANNAPIRLEFTYYLVK